jgi:hypothetical protein
MDCKKDGHHLQDDSQVDRREKGHQQPEDQDYDPTDRIAATTNGALARDRGYAVGPSAERADNRAYVAQTDDQEAEGVDNP